MGIMARSLGGRTVKAGPAQQLRVLLADTFATLTRGNSRQKLGVGDTRLANLRVARCRRRRTGLSHVSSAARVAEEPRQALAAGLTAQGAQQTRATLDQAMALHVHLAPCGHALKTEVKGAVLRKGFDVRY